MNNLLRKLTSKTAGIFLLLLIIAGTSCGDSDEENIPDTSTSGTPAMATEVVVSDIANTGDASDIRINFRGPSQNNDIKEFLAVVINAESNSDHTAAALEGQTNNRFVQIDKQQAIVYQIDIPATLVDTDGNDIIEGVEYVAAIISAPDGTLADQFAVSAASNSFTLTKQAEISTLVSNLAANDALTVDAEGNIYASNFGTWSSTGGSGTKILKITPSGDVSDFATGLHGPLGNYYEGNDQMLVIDDNNGSNGKVIRIEADKSQTLLAQISGWPAGIAKDNLGNIYISNYNTSNLHKIATDGTLSVHAQDARLQGAVGIVFDGSQNLYVANYNDGRILRVDMDGNVTEIANINVPDQFGLGYVTLLSGNLYATGIGDHNIYKISLQGSVEILSGNGTGAQSNGLAPNAGFANPNGIAADRTNKILYVTDWGQPGLRKIQVY